VPLIKYINSNETITQIDVPNGSTLMHGATVNMLDGILGECGGAVTCATCHCYIDMAWLGKTGKAGHRELEKLKLVKNRRPNSRLSCQIKVNDGLDGLTVYLPETQVLNTL